MRSGAPAVTPSVSAQAGNARPRFLHCRIHELTNWLIITVILLLRENSTHRRLAPGFTIVQTRDR
jgi:hypothetical protein